MFAEKSGFRQLTKNLIAGKKLIKGRTGMREPFMEIHRAVLACTVLGHLLRQLSHVSFMFLEHDGTITGRETGNLSRLASTRTELFRLTKSLKTGIKETRSSSQLAST